MKKIQKFEREFIYVYYHIIDKREKSRLQYIYIAM